MKKNAIFYLALVIGLHSGVVEAALVGQWTFEGANPRADSTGNFPDLLLQGDASIINGQLDVNGAGTAASGWAVTDSDTGAYSGPNITNKTLVSWLTLESLSAVTSAGSAITIDRISSDHFDGIIFAEVQPDRWMNGSSFFVRTQAFVPGFQETSTGQPIKMTITYEDLGGGNLRVTGYRDCQQIGQYVTGNASSWNTGDAEIFLGLRHGSTAGGPGALDALIEEARIYDEVLTAPEVCVLAFEPPKPIPSMNKWGILIFVFLAGLGAVFALRRNKISV